MKTVTAAVVSMLLGAALAVGAVHALVVSQRNAGHPANEPLVTFDVPSAGR